MHLEKILTGSIAIWSASRYVSRINTCSTLTCCQWSSSDGWAEKYPVSCMSCSSRNILPLGRSVSMATRDYEVPRGGPPLRPPLAGTTRRSSAKQRANPINQRTNKWQTDTAEPRRDTRSYACDTIINQLDSLRRTRYTWTRPLRNGYSRRTRAHVRT